MSAPALAVVKGRLCAARRWRGTRCLGALLAVALPALALLGAAFPASAQLAAGSFRDGLWEMTIRTDLPGVQSMPPMQLKRCITAREIQDLQAKATRPQGAEQCRVLDQQVKGNTTFWKVECTGKLKMTGEGSITASGDSYSMQSSMLMATPEGKTLQVKSEMSGKRLGECKP